MSHSLDRRSVLASGFSLAVLPGLLPSASMAIEPPHDVTYIEDFDELWRTLGERYCFFSEKRTDWAAVRRLYRPQAEVASSPEALLRVISGVLGELYDLHTNIDDPDPKALRGPYFDLWVEPNRDGTALITSVRDDSAAAEVGVRAGDSVLAVDGRMVQPIAAALMPRCLTRPDPAAAAYALNIAVSGRRAAPRRLTLRRAGGGEQDVLVPVKTPATLPDIDSRMLPEGFGYIVISSFADQAVIDQFDAALLRFRDTRGLVIDVRHNGGGDTAVARPIMGRFITETKPYAHMRRRQGAGLSPPWVELVEPRGPFTYAAPVAVLTTRWSASMAEGFPMGMRGLGRATIVGTPMMRLGAAVFQLRLDRTGLQLQYSGEPVYDVKDWPRWLLEPDILVPPADNILQVAVRHLQQVSGS